MGYRPCSGSLSRPETLRLGMWVVTTDSDGIVGKIIEFWCATASENPVRVLTGTHQGHPRGTHGYSQGYEGCSRALTRGTQGGTHGNFESLGKESVRVNPGTLGVRQGQPEYSQRYPPSTHSVTLRVLTAVPSEYPQRYSPRYSTGAPPRRARRRRRRHGGARAWTAPACRCRQPQRRLVRSAARRERRRPM